MKAEEDSYVVDVVRNTQQRLNFGVWVTDAYSVNWKRNVRLLPRLHPGTKLTSIVWDVISEGNTYTSTPINASISQMKAHIQKLYVGHSYYYKGVANWMRDSNLKLMTRCNVVPHEYRADWSTLSFVAFDEDRVADYALYLASSVDYFTSMGFEIEYLEVINEPNGFWSSYMTPQTYARVVRATKASLKELNLGAVRLLAPGLSSMYENPVANFDLESGNVTGNTVFSDPVEESWELQIEIPFTAAAYAHELATSEESWDAFDAWSAHGWDDNVLDVQTIQYTSLSMLNGAPPANLLDTMNNRSQYKFPKYNLFGLGQPETTDDSYNLSSPPIHVGNLDGYLYGINSFDAVIRKASRERGEDSIKDKIISEFGINRQLDALGNVMLHPTAEQAYGCYKTMEKDVNMTTFQFALHKIRIFLSMDESDMLDQFQTNPHSSELWPNSEAVRPEFGCNLFGHMLLFMNANFSNFNYWELADHIQYRELLGNITWEQAQKEQIKTAGS
eukprot:gene21289-25582_t